MDAIVYTSNSGFTKKYALLLGEKISLPVCSLKEADLKSGSDIIYLGWLMASNVRGLKKAKKKYNVKAVVGVGMGENGSQIAEIRKANKLDGSMPVFSLQGGFDLNKLHGIYKFMMTAMKKATCKGLSEKQDRTPEEDDMLDMMLNGGDRVKEENLKELLDWYSKQ